jgi:hypothetical protein
MEGDEADLKWKYQTVHLFVCMLIGYYCKRCCWNTDNYNIWFSLFIIAFYNALK